MPRNLARRRRRRKIRRIPLQRRRCRYWASPGPAKHFRPFLLGPRASSINCGFLFDINCGFLFDVGLNNSDANMVCVSVDDEMEGEPPSKTQQISGGGGENVRLRRRVCERKRTSKGEAQNTKKPRPAAAEEDKENSGAAASIPVLGESGSGKTQTILGRSSKVGGWAFCGRTPCLLVWLRRRTLEEAPSGQSTGAQGGTRVCLLGEYEFNRPWPEPESLSASRRGGGEN
jgi:hypothetical protein